MDLIKKRDKYGKKVLTNLYLPLYCSSTIKYCHKELQQC